MTTTTKTKPAAKPDPFADLISEYLAWTKKLDLPSNLSADELEVEIAARRIPISAGNRAWVKDFLKRWRKREDEVHGPKRFFAVTLEYHATYHMEVGVEARSVEQAIKLAYEDNGDGWRAYDDCGDTYVGHIAEHPSLESAENAYAHEGDCLPIPLVDREDREKLEALAADARVALKLLDQELYERRTSGNGEEFEALETFVDQLRATLKGVER